MGGARSSGKLWQRVEDFCGRRGGRNPPGLAKVVREEGRLPWLLTLVWILWSTALNLYTDDNDETLHLSVVQSVRTAG